MADEPEDEHDCYPRAEAVVETIVAGFLADGHDPFAMACALCDALVRLEDTFEIDTRRILGDFLEGEPEDNVTPIKSAN